MTENRGLADQVDPRNEVEMTRFEKSSPIPPNSINMEKEIKDILEDKDLEESLIKMILQNKLPILDINDNERFAKFLEIIKRDIDSSLSDELSKINETEDNTDKSQLLQKKITDYMLKIVRKIYEKPFNENPYSIMSTSKFDYEVIIDKKEHDDRRER